MKRNKVLTYLLFLLLPLAVGGLAALVTYHGMPETQGFMKDSALF